MNDACRLRAVLRQQGLQDGRVELPSPESREVLFQRAPGDLVPEPDPVVVQNEDTVLFGLGELVEGRAEQLLGEVGRDSASCYGQHLHGPPAAGAQLTGTRQNRVRDGVRDVVRRACQGLGDVERVARGQGVQLGSVPVAVPREGGDGVLGQRSEVDPESTKVAEQPPQTGTDRVRPKGDHQQQVEPVGATHQIAHGVERGVVRPVNVLDHKDLSSARRVLHGERVEEIVEGTAGQSPCDCTVRRSEGIAQRRENRRNQHVVARADACDDVGRQPVDERADQARLPDAGLTADGRDRPTVRPERAGELRQRSFPLEQHPYILAA